MNKEEKWKSFILKVNEKIIDDDELEINEIKPLDIERYNNKIVFVGQNPSNKREKSSKIFEYENVSDKVMNEFFELLSIIREEVYFTNLIKSSTKDNSIEHLTKEEIKKYEELFYEELDIIKPLVIISVSRWAQKIINKDKLKCPIIYLSHPSYYFRQCGDVKKAAAMMYQELKLGSISSFIKYDAKLNFVDKDICFRDEKSMIEFFKHANSLKIYHVGVDSRYNTVGIFVSNKEVFKYQIFYYNYCYIKCEEKEREKYSIDGNPVKKHFYSNYRELDDSLIYEKDLHSDFRFIIDYYDYFDEINIDDFNYMTYDIETNASVDVINTPGEIISIVYLLNDKCEFLMLNNNNNNFDNIKNKEDVKIFDTEKEMLLYFINIFQGCNLVTGFNISGFDNIYLVNRAKKIGIPQESFSPLNRVKNTLVVDEDRYDELKLKIEGVDLIDTMKYAKDKYFIYSLDKPSQYNLNYLGKFLKLGTKIEDSRGPSTLWREDPLRLYEYNIQDVMLCRNIEKYLNVVEYLLSFKKLIKTFNLKWSLYNSKIIDFFMLCTFSKDYAFPSKKDHGEEELEGAYVKEPISGIFRNVAILDFSALYPNIIRQFNISYETVSSENKEGFINVDNQFYFDVSKKGLFPKLVDELIFMKNDIGAQLKVAKDETTLTKYNAIKAVINGIYGVSKYRFFRLYNINCARSITHIARTLLKTVERLAKEDETLEPIYGDTDSVFIKARDDLDNPIEFFNEKTKVLNEKLTQFMKDNYNIENKFINLEFETLFDKLLMTKAKKKYYGIGKYVKGKLHAESKEYGRGIDLVKKDTPISIRPILKELLISIVNSDNDLKVLKEAVSKAETKIKNLHYNDLLITKQISRNLDEYKTIPQHVKAMLYSNKNLNTNFSRANYKGGLLYVIVTAKYPPTEVVMLEDDSVLPHEISVNYKKYFEIFVKNKVMLFLDSFKDIFSENKLLTQYFK